MQLPVMPPLAPMLAKAVTDIPPGLAYEPKWDGFRSIVFRDGDEVEIGSRNKRPMARYFPDVVAAVKANTPPRCVLDGEIVVPRAGDRGLDFWALQQRIHPAKSRIDRLAGETPASFIAFDLLALGDDDWTPRPFDERRGGLERALAAARPPVYVTPLTRDIAVARDWFERFEGAGLDGLVAKDPARPYRPGERVMTKVKHRRTADCVLAGYRLHTSLPGAVGALLLGLYADSEAPDLGWGEHFDGLIPIGVVGSFPARRRAELVEELEPLVIPIEDHPWGRVSEEARGRGYDRSRWNPDRDLSFVPLRPERVVEVRYEHMEGPHLRHPAQFVRWRPDRDAASCGFAQLEVPERLALGDVLSGRPA